MVDHLNPKVFRQYFGEKLAERVGEGALDEKNAKNPVKV